MCVCACVDQQARLYDSTLLLSQLRDYQPHRLLTVSDHHLLGKFLSHSYRGLMLVRFPLLFAKIFFQLCLFPISPATLLLTPAVTKIQQPKSRQEAHKLRSGQGTQEQMCVRLRREIVWG